MSEKGKNGNENIVCNEYIFSTQKTCEFFGISRETLSSWQKKGAPKESRGKWNLKKLVEWRFDGGHKESPEVRKLKAEADLKEAKAQQEKIKLGVTREEFVPTYEVAQELKKLFSVMKKNLLAIGHNVATELGSIDIEAAETARNVVDKEINEALEEMAKGGVIHERKRRKK